MCYLEKMTDTNDKDELELTKELSLVADILETIEGMLERPEMYAGSADSLETQFYTLVTLVAPYAFQMDARAAGQILTDYVTEISGTNSGIASKYDDIKEVAGLLKKCYNTYFDVIIEKENSTIH